MHIIKMNKQLRCSAHIVLTMLRASREFIPQSFFHHKKKPECSKRWMSRKNGSTTTLIRGVKTRVDSSSEWKVWGRALASRNLTPANCCDVVTVSTLLSFFSSSCVIFLFKNRANDRKASSWDRDEKWKSLYVTRRQQRARTRESYWTTRAKMKRKEKKSYWFCAEKS